MIRTSRMLVATATATLLATTAATSAAAAPVPVVGGSTSWAQANVYNAVPARTWLGHVTQPGVAMRGQSNGTAITSGGASVVAPDLTIGTTVGPTSARGVDQVFDFQYGSATGTYDAAAKTADVSSVGTVGFTQYPGLGAGAPPVLTFSNLRIVVSGSVGAVYASVTGTSAGQGGGAAPVYDPATPLFSLDASKATFTTEADGKVLVDGLVPTLANANAFPGNYAVGVAGPDRTPNNFGAFGLRLDLKVPAAPVAVAPVAPAAVTAPAPAAPIFVTETTKLSKAPFARFKNGKKTIKVKIRKRGEWTILGEGTLKNGKLTLKLVKGTTLAGKYVLRVVSGPKGLPKSTVVSIGGKKKAAKKAAKSAK